VIKLLLTTYFVKACMYQTKTPETEEQGEASHETIATYRPSKAVSNGRIRGDAGHMPRICRSGAHVYFIK
jgi:hypothetical protein